VYKSPSLVLLLVRLSLLLPLLLIIPHCYYCDAAAGVTFFSMRSPEVWWGRWKEKTYGTLHFALSFMIHLLFSSSFLFTLPRAKQS